MKLTHRIAAIFSCCLLLSSSSLSAAVSAEGNQETASCPCGDVNLDQTVDISDAVLLARFTAEDAEAGITAEGKKLADVNQDGNLTSDDTLLILKYIAKLIPDFSASGQIETDYQTVNLMKDIAVAEADAKAPNKVFSAAQYTFSTNLLKEADQGNTKQQNLMISPLSVSLALSMTANGAKEQTLAEMEKVLGGNLKIADLNAYYAGYLKALPNSETAQLHIANSIWFKNDPIIKVPQEFLQTNANYYHADAFQAAFDPQTVNDINSWVNENTHEMIPKLLDEIPNRDVFMYLINALAFEAEWLNPYYAKEISDGEFKPYGTDPVTVEMMMHDEFIYLEDDDATGFIKDYDGNDYAFAAILPKESENMTVSDYIGKMTPESLQNLIKNPQHCKVRATMPQFKFSYDTELSTVLKAIGMPAAFDKNAADFTGLNEEGGYISRVLHKTFIQVDEAGTKAGAATAVEMTRATSVEKEPKYVRLDRPFIFMIFDQKHNVPLFIGYVLNPAEEQS